MNKMRRAKTITPKKSESKSRAKTGEALEKVYEQLKQILEGHAPPFKLSNGGVRGKFSVQLVVPKPVALQMAAAILQKGYVGLYLMCICMNEEVKRKISPALLKLLQGKTCFHLKSLDEGLKKDIEAALALGTQAYRERGWLQP